MFLLEGNENTYYLTRNREYLIGRHVGDIIIKNQTLSRKHAKISVEEKSVFVQDCESKFFTKYNGKILLKNEKRKLEDGAKITFGEVEFTFKQLEGYVTCSTAIKEFENEIISIMKEVGGEYSKDWNDSCTHLTTSEIMVTLKVLHAIMDNKKIVTPNFWRVVLKNVKENKAPPDPSEFYPPLGESIIHATYLEYNPNRKNVFTDKTFAFWKKKRQLNMNSIILKAGGKTILVPSLKSKTNSEILDILNDCIVMDPEDSALEATYSSILEDYRKKRRIIPVQEIVLAILKCSCEENCNPLFDRAKTVFMRDAQETGPSKVVVGETECLLVASQKKEKSCVILPSSITENMINTQHQKRESQSQSVLSYAEKKEELSQGNKIEEVKMDLETPTRKKIAPFFKRPAQEPIAPSPKKPKTDHGTLKVNPFSIMKARKQEKESQSKECDIDLDMNPFGQMQLRKEVKIEDDVVIINDHDESSKKRKTTDNVDSTIPRKRTKMFSKKNRRFVELAAIDFSNLDHTVSGGTWIDSSVKGETQAPSNLDDEEQKWCERFNRSVVIVTKDLWRKDKENIYDVSVSVGESQVKNFKKFRKVPVPRSSQVIKCTKLVFGNKNLGVDYPASDDEDNRDI